MPLLENRTISLEESRNQTTLAQRAIASGEPAVANDLLAEMSDAWRDVWTRRSLRSCAVLPLRGHDQIIGLFELYAGEKNCGCLEI